MSRSLAFERNLSQNKQRLRLLQEKERLECEASFFFFVQRAWRILNPTTPFVAAKYLQFVCEHLELAVTGENNRLIVNVPPRTGKSSLVSVFLPVWTWLHAPSSRWLFASHAVDLALKHSRDRATLLQSPWFCRYWSRRFKLTLCNANEIKNDQRGAFLATTVTGSTGKGGNYLVLDDPHSAADAQSDALREKDNEQIRGSLMSRLDDPRRSTMIVIMQRLHEHDATGMLRELGGWTHVILPAEEQESRKLIFPKSGLVWARKAGDLLDPERFPAAVLKKLKRDMGALNYSGQYLQIPSTPGGAVFRRDWWRRYTPQELPTLDQVVVSVDAAFKSGRENDYVAVQTWGLAGNRSYLLEANTAHRSFTQTKDAIREAVRNSGATAVLVEEKANGSAIIEDLSGEFALIPINPGQDSKVARAMAVSPEVEAGLVYIPADDRYASFLDGLAKFPKARHDDDVDALTQLLHWRKRRTHGLFALWEQKMEATPSTATALTRKREATQAWWTSLFRG